MSRWKTEPVHFKCTNDCQITGCPGHDLVLEHHITSDTVSMLIDGQHHYTFSDDSLDALREAIDRPQKTID